MLQRNIKNYVIEEGVLETLDAKIVHAITDYIRKYSHDGILPAGNYRVKNFLRQTKFSFSLKHDLVNCGIVDVSNVKESEKIISVLTHERHQDKIFMDGEHVLTDGERLYYFVTNLPCQVRKHYESNVVSVINLDDRLGEGSSGSVYGILGTLKYRYIESKRLHFEPDTMQRTAKLESSQKNEDALSRSVTDECKYMRGFSHLDARPPFTGRSKKLGFVSGFSARRMHGQLLEDFIYDDVMVDQHAVDLKSRMQLSIALLKALKHQAHDRHLIHRDIKPGNIFNNRINNRWQINIIDYGISQFNDEINHRLAGTRAFCAPEIFKCQPCMGSDIYSMALVLAMIWRDKNQLRFACQHGTVVLKLREKSEWHIIFDMFHGIEGLSESLKAAIALLLDRMVDKDPVNRPDIDECIYVFEQIYLEFKLSTLPESCHAAVRASHQLAIDTRKELELKAQQPLEKCEQLQMLEKFLFDKIDLLADEPAAIQEFAETTDIEFLNDADNLKIRITEVIKSFAQQFDMTCAYQKTLLELQQNHHDIPSSSRHDLDDKISEINEFLDKIRKTPLDLNHVYAAANHLERKNIKLNHAVKYFKTLVTDEPVANTGFCP